MQRRESGFTFVEILVVMGIIVTLMGMVVVIVPHVLKKARRAESLSNVRSLAQLLSDRSISSGWPRYDGKRFVLSLVAHRIIDVRNPDNVELLYSPGDFWYTSELSPLELYREITPQALRAGVDVHTLTSYAGRRNATREHLITPDRLNQTVPILCDDDDGPVHDPDGLVMGFTDGGARFYEWGELDMEQPDDKDAPRPFLGDDATDGRGWLQGLASH